MSKKANKYALLEKREYDESGMIELTEFNSLGQPITKQVEGTETASYVKLEDESESTSKLTKTPKSDFLHQPKVNINQKVKEDGQKNNPPKNSHNQTQNSYNTPKYSSNPNPTSISLNGTNFRNENAPSMKKSKLPQMKVACNHCTFLQNVPATSQMYVCCACNNMNECFPMYGLFMCGHCQSKVCYPYGTSQMVRCTKCGTVNQVASEPKLSSKVQKTQLKTKVESESVAKNKTVAEERHEPVNFIEEEEIVLEQNSYPSLNESEAKFEEEELCLDDRPLKNKKESEEGK